MIRSTTDPRPRQRGMTLVELIAAVVIMGVIAGAASFFFVSGMTGFNQTRANSDLALKTQAALERMTLELRDMEGVSGTQVTVTSSSIQYASSVLSGTRVLAYDSANQRITLSVDGGTARTLLDEVSSFTLSVDVSEDLDGQGGANEISAVNIVFVAGGKAFTLQILPRQFVNL